MPRFSLRPAPAPSAPAQPVSGRLTLRRLALGVAVLSLGGCGLFTSSKYDKVACPAAGIVSDLAEVSRYNTPTPNPAFLTIKGRLTNLFGTCTLADSGVKIEVSITTLIERGPAGTESSYDLPYFVALADREDHIITKQIFPNVIPVKTGQNHAGAQDTETIKLAIEPKEAQRYRVLIGFQLSAEELARNRANE